MKTSLVAAALLVSSLALATRAHAAPNDGDDAANALVELDLGPFLNFRGHA
jgi:hypothetical protein